MDESLAGYCQSPFIGDGQRHVPEGSDVVGDELPLLAVAPGGAFHEPPVFVDELHGKPIQLQHEQGAMALQEGGQVAYLFRLSQGEQRDVMPHLLQAADSLIAYGLGGGVA